MKTRIYQLVLTFVLVLGLLAGIAVALPLSASATESPLTFEINPDGQSYTLAACNQEYAGAVEVPATYNGLPVTAIGYYAFDSCDAITSVTLPDTIDTIDNGAFFCCLSMTSINLPQNLRHIGDNAFSICTSLELPTIPASVIHIGENVFDSCDAITGFVVDPANEYYCNDAQGVLYSKDMTLLLRAPQSLSDTYAVPVGVTRLGHGCFKLCEKLTQVTLPETVSVIEGEAFNSCSALESIVIPEGVEYIDSQTFVFCSSLNELTLPDSLRSIYTCAFMHCTSLTSIVLPEGVERIDEYAFSICTSLTDVYLPYSVQTISYTAFSESNSVVIHCYKTSYAEAFATENSIPTQILAAPTGLRITRLPDKITYGLNSVLNLKGMRLAMDMDDSSSIEIFYGYTVAGDDFSTPGTKVITVSVGGFSASFEVVVDPSIITLPESAHPYPEECEQTWTYTHPTPADALLVTFSQDTETEEVYDVLQIYDGEYALVGEYSGTDLAGQTLTIAGNSFSITLISDESVTFYGFTVVSVEAVAASSGTCGDNLTWKLDDTGTLTVSGTGPMTDYTGNDIPWYDRRASITSVVVEPGVTTVGAYAFADCNNLESLSLPDSVTSIGNFAFDCFEGNNLQSVTFGSNISYIGMEAFQNCANLQTVTIPGTNTVVGPGCFMGCTGLQSVTISGTGVSLGANAFGGCDEMDTLTVTGTLSAVGSDTFYGCSALDSVYITDLAAWCATSFEYNISNPLYYANDLYVNGVLATQLVIPSGVEVINPYAFYRCECIESLVVPQSVTVIGKKAFNGCKNLKYVYYEGSGAQWQQIEIQSNNPVLETAIFDYNYEIVVQTPGDVTGTDGVTNDDVILLMWHVLFPEDNPLACNADFNGDNSVDNNDVILLMWHILFPEDNPLN